ncbi:MAG: class I SAM-dependent methyltransferase [Acidobacteriia bacterium]|nr:class I SAM-dependent methyltransferase [Terriglobia bacterium]
MKSDDSSLSKVSKWWDQSPEELEQRSLIAWMEHEHIKRHINRRTTGDESLDWFRYILQQYFPTPVNRALSLGCGDGGLERYALHAGAVAIFDAYDASSGAIETARKTAEIEGLLPRINYAVADLNQLQVPINRYEAVFASMSIHHVQALEAVFEGVRNGLKPSGYFILNEYIGPTRFQLPPIQIKLINDLLNILPQDLRRIIREGKVTTEIKSGHQIHPLSWFDDNDPSEAVRSSDILPLLQRFFRIIEFKPYGGTLLQFILENIAGNFDEKQAEHRAWLDVLAYLENTLEDAGLIGSDFALIVASQKTLGSKDKSPAFVTGSLG